MHGNGCSYEDRVALANQRLVQDHVAWHVYPSSYRGWAVRPTWNLRALRSFTTKQAAESFALSAKNKNAYPVYIHDGDGSLVCVHRANT
jgi:hypothetical protein